jgi:hypothetical protein
LESGGNGSAFLDEWEIMRIEFAEDGASAKLNGHLASGAAAAKGVEDTTRKK